MPVLFFLSRTTLHRYNVQFMHTALEIPKEPTGSYRKLA